MADRLVIPVSLVAQAIESLRVWRTRTLTLTVGRRDATNDRIWLAQSLGVGGPERGFRGFDVVSARARPALISRDPFENVHPIVGRLSIGDGPNRGRLWGDVFDFGVEGPLADITVVGPGMHRIDGASGIDPESPADRPEGDRWSRTAGALGGVRAWRRLSRLTAAVVGVGRMGSVMADLLYRLGLSLVLVDADIVEPHNVAESALVGEDDVGLPKAMAVAARLQSVVNAAGSTIECVRGRIQDPAAIELVRQADLVVSSVDNDAARLLAGTIACAHLALLIDVGTGIFLDERRGRVAVPERRMGADVRLVVPGDGCILCRGGLTDLRGAVEQLTWRSEPNASEESTRTRKRAGSLRSLNQMAAALAVRLLEDLVTRRVNGSVWARVAFAEDGVASVSYPLAGESVALHGSCQLCARAGFGERAL
jgi:hypothetical protein